MKYILKGCSSAKGFEKLKDGDEVPVGWFDEATFEKMVRKGTIKKIGFEETVIQESEHESEIEKVENTEEIFENKKKGVRRK
jgi:hypothetical protein